MKRREFIAGVGAAAVLPVLPALPTAVCTGVDAALPAGEMPTLVEVERLVRSAAAKLAHDIQCDMLGVH